METKELLELKQSISASKEKVSKLKGRRDLLREELEEKYQVTTIAEAKKKVASLDTKIQKKSDKIKEKTAALENQLNEHTDTD